MSLAKILHEKGFHKGIRKGEWLVAKRMLQDGADTEFVSKMTGLTAQELDQVEEIL